MTPPRRAGRSCRGDETQDTVRVGTKPLDTVNCTVQDFGASYGPKENFLHWKQKAFVSQIVPSC